MVRSRELKALRVFRGFTLQEMAEKIGRSSAAYSHKESGSAAFSDEEKVILVNELEMSFEQFNNIFFDGKLTF